MAVRNPLHWRSEVLASTEELFIREICYSHEQRKQTFMWIIQSLKHRVLGAKLAIFQTFLKPGSDLYLSTNSDLLLEDPTYSFLKTNILIPPALCLL